MIHPKNNHHGLFLSRREFVRETCAYVWHLRPSLVGKSVTVTELLKGIRHGKWGLVGFHTEKVWYYRCDTD